MSKACPNCNGSRRIRRNTRRTWWQIVLLRPASLDELCPVCVGTGVVRGPEEEKELSLQPQRHQEAKEREAAEQQTREVAEEKARMAAWLASPPPKGKTSQAVDAWMRAHVGVQVVIAFGAVVDGYTHGDSGRWIVAPPLTLDPLAWQLPVVNSFYIHGHGRKAWRPPAEILSLAPSEDVGLVYYAKSKSPTPAYHEAEVSSNHMLYRVGFSEHSYETGDGGVTESNPTTDQRRVKFWQTYEFSVRDEGDSTTRR
jgi:hypothetical protein